MRARKSVAVIIVLIIFIVQLTGCSQGKSTAKQIAPLDRNKIKVIMINQGNQVTKELEDEEVLKNLFNDLDSIKFLKMSIKQEEKVFEQGKIFNKDTTYVIELMEDKWGISKADMIVISEKELVLADSETMGKTRTVSYINQGDESSLNAVKEIYSLAQKAMN